MELNFKLQRNEELRLQKLVNKMTRRHNRHHIVEDMIEVRKAKKIAVSVQIKGPTKGTNSSTAAIVPKTKA